VQAEVFAPLQQWTANISDAVVRNIMRKVRAFFLVWQSHAQQVGKGQQMGQLSNPTSHSSSAVENA
jgi:hypothetical protein